MKRSAIAFARGARTGVRMIRMSAPVKTASKAVVNLLSRSRIRNRNCVGAVAEVHEQVAGLLGDPGSGGVGGDPGEVHAAAAVLDHEEDVEAAQEDGVDVGEVDREDRVGLRGQELSPGRAGSSGRGIEPGVLEDLPCVLNAERSRCRSSFLMRCCVNDEGCWPFGAVLRRKASNHLMLRWLKTVVVSDEEKAP